MVRRRSPRNPSGSRFPHPSVASPEGIVAIGGQVTAEVLVDAYSHGIFPWPHEDLPLLWFSPDPRFVLLPSFAHLPRSLRKRMRKGEYEIRADTAFVEVMRGCAETPRPGQGGTWINEKLIAGYSSLFEHGLAHSIEAWQDGKLVGGFYGVSLGSGFFGESMFARAPDASKVAFATFIAQAIAWQLHFIDCQVYTEHLERFGAEDWPREDYLAALAEALKEPTRQGPWTLDVTSAEAVEILERARAEVTALDAEEE